MEDVISKLDETTLRIVKTMPVQIDVKLDELMEKKVRLEAERARFNANIDLQIAEIDGYLAECQKLEVKSEIALKEAVEVEPIELKEPIITK
jgi:hypothetical protein